MFRASSRKGESNRRHSRTSKGTAMKNVRSLNLYLCLSVFISGFLFPRLASAQDWFRTGTGLGVSKARVGVADFAPKSPNAQPLAAEFADVVRTDRDYSGILELVSKSYNP